MQIYFSEMPLFQKNVDWEVLCVIIRQ